MAKVNICDVEVLDNPSGFRDKFKFRITFECHDPLEDDLEWKLIYVSSAYNESLDQTLDSILVGPVPVGRHQFSFEADPPDHSKIPMDDIVGVTVVLIQALYRDKEFIRVGYYVNNEYKSEEMRLEPPSEPILDELERHIIASDPRVTRFAIDWGDGLLDGCPEPEQPQEDGQNGEHQEIMEEDHEEDEQEEDSEDDYEELDQDPLNQPSTSRNNNRHGDENLIDGDAAVTSDESPAVSTKVDTSGSGHSSSTHTGVNGNSGGVSEPLHQVQPTV